jgi:hypothetical protein
MLQMFFHPALGDAEYLRELVGGEPGTGEQIDQPLPGSAFR